MYIQFGRLFSYLQEPSVLTVRFVPVLPVVKAFATLDRSTISAVPPPWKETCVLYQSKQRGHREMIAFEMPLHEGEKC